MSGELRRRKNAPRSADGPSVPASSSRDDDFDDPSTGKRRPRPSPSKYKDYDEHAWLAVFLAALSYFVITRGGSGSNNRRGVLSSFSKPYDVIASSVGVADGNEESERLLRSTFYVAKSQIKESTSLVLEPNRRLEVILSSPPDAIESDHDKACFSGDEKNQKQQPVPYLSHLASTAWVHDDELGRGYLLLADAGRAGRIWRWEVGGGPITIGRSLHMERSGCRSGLWVDVDAADGGKGGRNGTCPENLFGESGCSKSSLSQSKVLPSMYPPLLGSASLAVELTRNAERSSAGSNLVVAEWGERRIVRVEGESGARTPLVTTVPDPDDKTESRRVFRPSHLLYTPFGDLLFSDDLAGDASPARNSSHYGGAVYRRKEAVHVPAIAAEQSREAHGWTSTSNGEEQDDGASIDVLFRTEGTIEGMALGTDYSALYILANAPNDSGWTKTVYKLRLNAEEDDDEDSGDEGSDTAKEESSVFYHITSADCIDHDGDARPHASVGSKLAVDEKGTLYLIACPSSVSLLSQDGRVVGTLPVDSAQKSQTTFFTSVGFGEDGYLYVTSPNGLMRVKSRVGGMSLPTDMVVPPLLKPRQDGQQRRDKRDKL